MELQGYQFTDRLHQGERCDFWRVRSLDSNRPLLAKILAKDRPQVGDFMALRREEMLRQRLDKADVVPDFRAARGGGVAGILYEDRGCQSLSLLIERNGSLDPAGFLDLAVAFCRQLKILHEADIAAGSFHPSRWLWNPDSGQLWFVGLDVAADLRAGNGFAQMDFGLDELVYMAPEQTGMFDREPGIASDVYGLGCLFFYFLCGRRPFRGDSRLELSREQLINQTLRLKQFRPNLPPVLCQIVEHMMQPNPDNRYRSLDVLRRDLLSCQRRLETGSMSGYSLARRERNNMMAWPERFYGDNSVLANLREIYMRSCLDSRQVLVMGGPSLEMQITLVEELRQTIIINKGLMVVARGDEIQPPLPRTQAKTGLAPLVPKGRVLPALFAKLASALPALPGDHRLSGKILRESHPSSEKLLWYLSPDLADLYGFERPDHLDHEGVDEDALLSLIGEFFEMMVFAGQPLVMALFDCPDLDPFDLKILQQLLDRPGRNILFILTRQVSDASNIRAANRISDALDRSGQVELLYVPGLSSTQMVAWLSETLGVTQEVAQELGEGLSPKCEPWPEDLREALATLEQSGGIWYESVWQRWMWAIDDVDQMSPSRQRTQRLKDQIETVTGDLASVLKAACSLQGAFDLPTLARICGFEMRYVRASAVEARKAGIWNVDRRLGRRGEGVAQQSMAIVPVEQNAKRSWVTEAALLGADDEHETQLGFDYFTRKVWTFSHPEIRETVMAQETLEDADVAKLRTLLDSYWQGRMAEDYFVQTAQLALRLLDKLSLDDHPAVVDLLVAATGKLPPHERKAFASKAQHVSWALVRPGDWGDYHDRCMFIGTRVLRSLASSEETARFQALQLELLSRCWNAEEVIRLKLMALDRYINLNQLEKAVEYGLETLAEMQVILPRRPVRLSSISRTMMAQASIELKTGGIERLSGQMPPGRHRHIMDIYGRIMSCLPNLRDPLVMPISADMVLLTLEKGWHPSSGIAFATHASLISKWPGDHKRAMQYSQFAMDMAGTRESSLWLARICLLNARMSSAKGQAAAGLTWLRRGHALKSRANEYEWAVHCGCEDFLFGFFRGLPLTELVTRIPDLMDDVAGLSMRRRRVTAFLYMAKVVDNILTSPVPFQADDFVAFFASDSDPIARQMNLPLPDAEGQGQPLHVQQAFILKLTAFCSLVQHVLIGDFEGAALILDDGGYFPSQGFEGTDGLHWRFFTLIGGLGKDGAVSTEMLGKEIRSLHQMARKDGSVHLARMRILQAEVQHLSGNLDEAVDFVERAIADARHYGNFIEEIIGCLRLAEMLRDPGRDEERRRAIRFARNAALAWGSAALGASIEERHKDVMMEFGQEYRRSAYGLKATMDGANHVVDVEALSQASQVIAGEVRLGELLKKMMRMVAGVAAAERGLLILESDGEWRVQAELAGNNDSIRVLEDRALSASFTATSVIHYVIRTAEPVVMDDAGQDLTFANDPYLLRQAPRSLICLPLLNQSSVRAVLYLENNIVTGAFSNSSVDVLSFLSAQMAVSIENARLYERMETINRQLKDLNVNLEKTVDERTADLTTKTLVLESTFETMRDGLVAFDGKGIVKEYNSEIVLMFGLEPGADIHGKSYRDIFRSFVELGISSGQGLTKEAIEEEVNRMTGPFLDDADRLEYSMEILSGTGKYYHLQMRRMENSDGWIVKCVDVTDERHKESELRSAITRAEAANEAKSRFLATMSHEIRTPMNGVIGMIDLLRDTRLSQEQQELTRVVGDSAGNLLNIIDEILDFSKIEAGKLSIEIIEMELRDLVEQVIDLLTGRANGKGIELAVYIDPQIPDMLLGDPVRVRQILINLIGNAIKFTVEGHVAVVVAIESDESDICSLRFEVRDTGIGLSKDAQERLFIAFEQADDTTTRRFGGTGLGLAISKNLVELMGGRIGLDSIEGTGSTFWFNLPIVKRGDKKLDIGVDLSGLRVGVAANFTVLQDGLEAILHRQDIDIARMGEQEWQACDVLVIDDNFTDSLLLATDQPVIRIGRHDVCEDFDDVDGYLVKPIRRRSLLQEIAIVAGRAKRDYFQAAMSERAISYQAPETEYALQQGGLVLVAEDNETNRIVILRQLARLGIACDVVNDGAAAWEALQKKAYGLLLTDCHMPHLDGYSLTDRIRRDESESAPRKRLPVIALTANALAGESLVAIQRGMDDFLSKPVKLDELERVLLKWAPVLGDLRQREDISDPDNDLDVLVIDDADAGDQIDSRGPNPDVMDLTLVLSVFGDLNEDAISMINRFLETTRPAVTDLARHDGQDIESLRDIAHQVAGAARTAGAGKLAALAVAVEKAVLAEDIPGALATRIGLDEIWQEIEEFVAGL